MFVPRFVGQCDAYRGASSSCWTPASAPAGVAPACLTLSCTQPACAVAPARLCIRAPTLPCLHAAYCSSPHPGTRPGALLPNHSYPAPTTSPHPPASPRRKHAFRNSGLGSTSPIVASCTDQLVPADVDMVVSAGAVCSGPSGHLRLLMCLPPFRCRGPCALPLLSAVAAPPSFVTGDILNHPSGQQVLEFTYNEPPGAGYSGAARRSFELLIRRLLHQPGPPALVMLHHYSWFMTLVRFDHTCAVALLLPRAFVPLCASTVGGCCPTAHAS